MFRRNASSVASGIVAAKASATTVPAAISSSPRRVATASANAVPAPSPGAGQEHQDAELAEHDIGAVTDLPRHWSGAGDVAEDQPDDQRPSTGAELQLDVAGQRDRHDPEQQTCGDAEGEADRVDLGEAPLGVAEQPGDRAQLVARPDDADTVAELQHEVVVGQHVVVAAAHAGDRHTVAADQVEIGQAAAGHLPIGHDDSPEVEHACDRAADVGRSDRRRPRRTRRLPPRAR